MFIRGSRYRNLPESSPLDAAGQRLLGKNLREIPPPLAGPFRHTVLDGDRLDLLSFKYYGDPVKWWQIADANPEEAFPTDLLDRSPLVKERFLLRNPDFETRLRTLDLELAALGVTRPDLSLLTDSKPAEPSFIETTLVVMYPPSPATHQEIVNTIESPTVGFHFLRAFAWTLPPDTDTLEAFTFDDQTTRDAWRNMLFSLMALGVLELESVIAESTLDLIYNSAITPRQSIATVIQSKGFILEPGTTAFPTVGSKIVIPPYQTV
jgi:hypothetical protein